MTLTLTASVERWPIAGKFVISRGARTEAVVVVAEIRDGEHIGRGECVPYPRYGETVEGVRETIAAAKLTSADRSLIQDLLPPGAARNAIDCALWDLEAKATGVPAWRRAGISSPHAVTTAYTLSLGSPEAMAEAAARASDRPLLKLKLGGDGDPERLTAVRASVPNARLVADANEAWNATNFEKNLRACRDVGVGLVEQPLPAGRDEMLREVAHIVPICADESVHTAADLDGLVGKYDAVNVKLDKAGGLTEALHLVRAARGRGLGVIVGCMVGTSLAMAPAMLAAQDADLVDLDGPLLLARDRVPGLVYRNAVVELPAPELWG
jgi:L-alanine-DL-glutamate epimerase-like enolase superfamily enzyme